MNYFERDSYGMYSGSSKSGPGPRLMGANTLLDNDVYNLQGEKVGDIKEFMLDMQDGRVAYAVLSFGGFLGMGEKLFAVPWKALTLDTKNHRFTMDVSRERLENAPGFDKNRWPDMSDPSWTVSIHEYYGTQPYVMGTTGSMGASDTAGTVGTSGASGTGGTSGTSGSMTGSSGSSGSMGTSGSAGTSGATSGTLGTSGTSGTKGY